MISKQVADRLQAVKLGTAQTFQNITVFPLLNGGAGGLRYLTLAEALAAHQFQVTEVSFGGNVPELKVANDAVVPVLLLDGEELAGAKQNRVLNTSVLVPEKCVIVIPVSCTEQGRWSYASDQSHDSGTVMAHSIRARKSRSVSASLHENACFSSNQGEVWQDISELQSRCGVASPTGAMRDVFEARSKQSADALAAFHPVGDQVGMLVILGGRAAGLDILSNAAAYTHLHGKLIKSYVVDAMSEQDGQATDGPMDIERTAHDFLARGLACDEKQFKSVGYGDDLRFQGVSVVGSALVHEGVVVHTAFFANPPETEAGVMSAFSRRRSYRNRN